MNTGEKLKRSRPVEQSEEALSNRSPRAASTAGRGSNIPYRLSPAAKQNVRVRVAWLAGRGRRHQTKGPSKCHLGGHGRRRHDRRAAAAGAPSAPEHRAHGIHDACPLRQLRSTSACLPEAQSRRSRSKTASLIQAPPLEHLVGVNAVLHRNTRDRRARFHRLLHDQPPLLDTPSPTWRR
jgi:hypothetical protein